MRLGRICNPTATSISIFNAKEILINQIITTMQTLIIILIIVLIAQTCVFIYAHFIDIANNRLAAASQQMVASAQEAFLSEKQRLQECIDNRDRTIKEWVKKYEALASQQSYLIGQYNKLKEERTLIINGDIKGTDTDGGVKGEKGEEGKV